jgi:hypothetical protein
VAARCRKIVVLMTAVWINANATTRLMMSDVSTE